MALVLVLPCFAFAAQTEDIGDGYFRYTDTITLTTAKVDPGATVCADPNDTTESNALTKKILEKFNVDVKTDWTSEEYYTKLSLMITADTLPDVFILNNAHYSMWAELVDNDMLMDMTDVFNTYASDYYREVLDGYGNRPMEAITRNGRIYGLSTGNYYYNDDNYLWIRQDWLEALGLKQPETMDDLEKILIAFRDNYGSKGLMINKPSGSTYNSLSSFAASFGAYLGAWVEGEDGRAVYGSLNQGTKEMLEVLHRWYEEGLINPEFMTSNGDSNAAAFANGETGTLIGKWWSCVSFPSVINLEGAEVSVCACPVDKDGKFTLLLPADVMYILCVNKNCEHPEAVMEIVNYILDLNGEFGEIYNKYQAEGTTWWAFYPFGEFNVASASQIVDTYYGIEEYVATGELTKNYQQTTIIKQIGDKLLGKEVDVDDGTMFWYKLGFYDAASLMVKDNIKLQGQVFSSTTESMPDLWSNLQTLETTCFISIIMGEQDINSFDEFVSTWYAEGGELITKEVNEILGR